MVPLSSEMETLLELQPGGCSETLLTEPPSPRVLSVPQEWPDRPASSSHPLEDESLALVAQVRPKKLHELYSEELSEAVPGPLPEWKSDLNLLKAVVLTGFDCES